MPGATLRATLWLTPRPRATATPSKDLGLHLGLSLDYTSLPGSRPVPGAVPATKIGPETRQTGAWRQAGAPVRPRG